MNQQPASFAKIIAGISAGVTVCMACLFASIVLREEVEIVGKIGLFFSLVVGMIFVSLLIWAAGERVLTIRAQRKETQGIARKAWNEADVMSFTAPPGSTMILRDLNPDAIHRNATIDPRITANGKYVSPTEDDWKAKLLFIESMRSRDSKIVESAGLLPEPSLDLLTVFSQPMQAYATIGGQQTGKTYQNQHIASAWVRQGTIPYVIATKWDIGEWPGCKLLGGNADWSKVERGLALIQEKATERHDSKLHHKSHPILPVFIDDWTPTVNQVKSATDLILNATTMFASVNMILYFIIHSDTADAWGVGKKGAALKNNFVKLFIRPQRDLNGSLIFSQSKGEIIFPGESDPHPVQLINSPIAQSPMVVEANAETPKPKEPTEQDMKILELSNRGLSMRQISYEVWGDHGGPRNDEIRKVLKDFGRV